MIRNWSHLKFVSREIRNRDHYTTYTGFSSKEEVEEYDRYYQENWYVYFPKVTKIWEENGNWFCILRTADSCD